MKERTPIQVDEFNIDSIIKVEDKKQALLGALQVLIVYILLRDKFGISSFLLDILAWVSEDLAFIVGCLGYLILCAFGAYCIAWTIVHFLSSFQEGDLKKIRNDLLDGKIRPVFHLDRKYVFENVFITDDNCLYIGADCYKNPNIEDSYVQAKTFGNSESFFIVLRFNTIENNPIRRIKVPSMDIGEREALRLLNFMRYH